MASTRDCCELLPWDSSFFGRQIARVTEHRLTKQTLCDIASFCRRHRVECLYLLADADDDDTTALCEASAFHLVDIRVTFHKDLAAPDTITALPTPAIRVYNPADLPALRSIAQVGHRGSRFYFDGHFPRTRCDDLYETWIERSANGWADTVLVAESGDGHPAGYISCHLSSSATGSIGLMAVDARFQRRHLGQQLVAASLRYFRQHGMRSAIVVTQGRNYPSQRLYQRCSFLTQSMQLWYHRWFSYDVLPNPLQ